VTGRESEIEEWQNLMSQLKEKEIPVIRLSGGDKINQNENVISFLSPTPAISQSGELNDTSFVNLVDLGKFKLLLTGDIGFSIEGFLTSNFSGLSADILKVGHHGSKYSTSEAFLGAVKPKVAVIEVGENRYGHPTSEVLDRLSEMKVFRTDEDGTIKVVADGTKLQIYTNR
ncbi:MAG: MBL fold metallo-hydrolase, partial [bacterium]|nr:MBL fold metallo-hydrolase [bacterium]